MINLTYSSPLPTLWLLWARVRQPRRSSSDFNGERLVERGLKLSPLSCHLLLTSGAREVLGITVTWPQQSKISPARLQGCQSKLRLPNSLIRSYHQKSNRPFGKPSHFVWENALVKGERLFWKATAPRRRETTRQTPQQPSSAGPSPPPPAPFTAPDVVRAPCAGQKPPPRLHSWSLRAMRKTLRLLLRH